MYSINKFKLFHNIFSIHINYYLKLIKNNNIYMLLDHGHTNYIPTNNTQQYPNLISKQLQLLVSYITSFKYAPKSNAITHSHFHQKMGQFLIMLKGGILFHVIIYLSRCVLVFETHQATTTQLW
jgi:hypothetical protein